MVKKKNMKPSFLISLFGILLLTACTHSTPEEYVLDSSTTTNVKAAFFQDTELNADKIHVKTEDQTVYLTGTVTDEHQIELAKNVAKQVENVQSVRESLDVKN